MDRSSPNQITLHNDAINSNIVLRRDLAAILQSAVDHDLSRGNLREENTVGGGIVYDQCGGKFNCGENRHASDSDSDTQVRTLAPPCGVCCTRRLLFSALPADARLYVSEVTRALGDTTRLDSRGGSIGTGSSSFRASPLEHAEDVNPRLGDLRKLLVQELQLLCILVSGAEQGTEPDQRSSEAVLQDVRRINELQSILEAVFHDLVLPLDSLPPFVLRCPIIVELFGVVLDVFEAVISASCRAAVRLAVLAHSNHGHHPVANGQSVNLPSNASELNNILSRGCQAVLADFLRFILQSQVVQIAARARLGDNGRGYRPMAQYNILSRWQDCELHKFWCRTVLVFSAVPRWCRVSRAALESASGGGSAAHHASRVGPLLLWPALVKVCYEFSTTHGDVLHRVLPVLTSNHRNKLDDSYDHTMSLRTFEELDAVLALFYELYTREHLRSWMLELKVGAYERLKVYQAKVFSSVFDAIHWLVVFLRNPSMRWKKSCAYNKHERRTLIKNKILQEWKFLRYYLAIIVQFFPSINDSSRGGLNSSFSNNPKAAAPSSVDEKTRSANGFDRIVIDAMFRALSKVRRSLLSHVLAPRCSVVIVLHLARL